MAREVRTWLVDDTDGVSDAEETLTFGLDGVSYAIDLTHTNAARMRTDLAPWVAAARRTGGRRRSSSAPN
ncbi:Lsr2 dimerization domain-containing protein, partial [Phycicoccus jejuensis]|uniref:Lsr2 dimerization domain-containing protein n=1 Tax=Phycicoccus jejuensis TaxID=367299 RepID=UPI0004C2F910